MHRVALIEDNPDNRLFIVALLEDEYLIDEYVGGEEALVGMELNPPDVILLDISLPGMDGTEVLQKLKQGKLSKIPTVALTAHAMEGDRERFLSMGFDSYMSKPIVDLDALFELLRRLLA